MLTRLFKCRNVGLWQIPLEPGGARRRWWGRRGFSLVEMTITLVIMGVIAGVAVPRFTESDRRYRVDAAVRRMIDDVKLMRQLARAQGVQQVMTVSRAGYVIPTLSSKDQGKAARYTVRWIDAPYEVDVAALVATNNQIKVNSSGDVLSTAEVTLQRGSYARIIKFRNDGTITVTSTSAVATVKVTAAPDDVTAVVEIDR
ncbi:MAG: prepilin-type N-terminal cleavage/methylation domain-containing protein [Planctomycetes bacterium]|nr:prepilin-type N-terminal cleavage/methylation domain-containing protein [Planctomycetota bacterium]